MRVSKLVLLVFHEITFCQFHQGLNSYVLYLTHYAKYQLPGNCLMLLLQILSTEPDHLRVANGIIAEIGNSHVSVSTSV